MQCLLQREPCLIGCHCFVQHPPNRFFAKVVGVGICVQLFNLFPSMQHFTSHRGQKVAQHPPQPALPSRKAHMGENASKYSTPRHMFGLKFAPSVSNENVIHHPVVAACTQGNDDETSKRRKEVADPCKSFGLLLVPFRSLLTFSKMQPSPAQSSSASLSRTGNSVFFRTGTSVRL